MKMQPEKKEKRQHRNHSPQALGMKYVLWIFKLVTTYGFINN